MRLVCVLLIFLLVFNFTGHCEESDTATPDMPEMGSIDKYFPMEPGVTYVYRISSLHRDVRLSLNEVGYESMDDEYSHQHFVMQTRSLEIPAGTVFDIYGTEDRHDRSGPVFESGKYMGSSTRSGRFLPNNNMFCGLHVFPPDQFEAGTEWKTESLPYYDINMSSTGSVAGIEKVEVFGRKYAGCLHLQHSLEIHSDLDSWIFGEGKVYVQGTMDLWFAPDTGLVSGTLVLENLVSDLAFVQPYMILQGAELFRLDLLARVPAPTN